MSKFRIDLVCGFIAKWQVFVSEVRPYFMFDSYFWTSLVTVILCV